MCFTFLRKLLCNDPWYLAGGVPAGACVAAYQPKGASSLEGSYTNLANPGLYTAAPGTAPSWDVESGWKFADNQYLTTGLIPQAGYSAIIKFSNKENANNLINFGVLQTTPTGRYFYIGSTQSIGLVYAYAAVASQGPILTSGVLAVTPTAGYRNGVFDKATGAAWLTLTQGIFINGSNLNGGLYGAGEQYIQALAVYSVDIAPQVSALTLAMNAL